MNMSLHKSKIAILTIIISFTLIMLYYYAQLYINRVIISRVEDVINGECFKYGEDDYTWERPIYDAAVSHMRSISGNDKYILRNGKIDDMKICDRGGYYEVKIFLHNYDLRPSPVVLIEKDTNKVIYSYLQQ